MNKQDLILQLANKEELTQKKADEILSTTLEAIMKSVSKGEKVTLVGFGTFEARKRKERKGRNPKTGEEIQISASTVPKFSAGKQFKSSVNRR
ncbi:MAG: DNA-binding protein [Candidatus Melainabacteria bacterium RIFCSPHIGHO2_02_FULL_34_12]|nr:MAG: DNA-binding protein [Candidatus Melainabacteria bacterium RIFCSPHIGHO2_02_FULL_34_12]